MRTILIVGGIILAGATIIAVVQNDRKKNATPEVQQSQSAPVNSVPDAAAPALNPAHGLASHRCDLPVGAPLTGGSGTTAPIQASPNINMNQVPGQVPQQPASAAPSGIKVNPAHGQPGHRCDLQVGAPLT
jgi:hypothetical protein